MRRAPFDLRLRLLAAAAIVGACSAATIHTPPPDAILFSHHVHLEQGLSCDDCHAQVMRDAADPAVKERMKMSACGDCHDVQDKAKCGTCHTTPQPEAYGELPETHLLFSHERHAERTTDCAACHAGATTAPNFSPKDRLLPAHPECNACHQKDMDAGRCRLCHDRLDFDPRKPKAVYSHEEGFFERHGLKAAAGEQDQCAECHDQSFCADCHARTTTVTPALRFPERVDRNRIHEGDWISRHVIEARTGDTACLKCHGTSFCDACHERSGVGGATGQRNPHPSSWMAPGASADNHGRAARRHIEECAACHDQGPASNCVQCHRSGGVNPHPPGGQSAVPRSERAHHKMCKICHSS
jgi:c(7)-type cytochrome triheme protein